MIQVNAHIHMKIIERHSDGIEHCHRRELDDPFPFKKQPVRQQKTDESHGDIDRISGKNHQSHGSGKENPGQKKKQLSFFRRQKTALDFIEKIPCGKKI